MHTIEKAVPPRAYEEFSCNFIHLAKPADNQLTAIGAAARANFLHETPKDLVLSFLASWAQIVFQQ